MFIPINDLEVWTIMREREAGLVRPEVRQREEVLRDRKPRRSWLASFWTKLSLQRPHDAFEPMNEELARAYILARR